MKSFNINSAMLLESLSLIKNVINSKNTLQILDDYLFEVNQNTISVTATDLETRLSTNITLHTPAESPFSFCINAKKLNDILAMLKGRDITITINENTSVIKSPMGEYKIPVEQSEDFPKQQDIKSINTLNIKAIDLYNGLYYTLFATSSEPARPIFNSVNLSIKDQIDIRFTATDSHRLSRYTIPNMSDISSLSINIPVKTSNTILPILKEEPDNDISMQISDEQICILTKKFQISARLVEGNFPDCDRIIPQSFKFEHNVSTLNLQDAIKRVAYFANAKTNMIKFSFDEKNKIAISSQDFDFSTSATESVDMNPAIDINPSINSEEKEQPIGFKSKFFLDFLERVKTPDVNIKLNTPTTPCIIQPTDEKYNITFLLMPMSIQ